MDFDIKKLMEQAKEVQARLEASQQKLVNETATGSSGGDMVKVLINGSMRVLSINISDELMVSNDKKMLEDLVVAAVNNAIDNIQAINKIEMNKITSNFTNLV